MMCETDYVGMENFFITRYNNSGSTFIEDMAKITALYNVGKHRIYDFIYYLTQRGVYDIEDTTKFLLVIHPHLTEINFTFEHVYALREELAYISRRNHALGIRSELENVSEAISKITRDQTFPEFEDLVNSKEK